MREQRNGRIHYNYKRKNAIGINFEHIYIMLLHLGLQNHSNHRIWMNKQQLNLTKIEQLGTGSVYCQIIDVLYPGSVSMNRVSWKARNDWEFIVNLKILQQSFQKNKIKKYIEVTHTHHIILFNFIHL